MTSTTPSLEWLKEAERLLDRVVEISYEIGCIGVFDAEGRNVIEDDGYLDARAALLAHLGSVVAASPKEAAAQEGVPESSC